MSISSFKALVKDFVDNEFAEYTQVYSFEAITKTPDGQGGFTQYSRKFSFEFIAGLTNDMRILYDGDYYNVRSIKSAQDSTIWIDVLADKDLAS